MNPFTALLPTHDLDPDSAAETIISAVVDGIGQCDLEVPLHRVPTFIQALSDLSSFIAQSVRERLIEGDMPQHFVHHLSESIEWEFDGENTFCIWLSSLKTDPVPDPRTLGMLPSFLPSATVFPETIFDYSPTPLVRSYAIEPLGPALTKFVEKVFRGVECKIFNELFSDLFEGGKRLNPWYVFTLNENGELVVTETEETCGLRLANLAQLREKNLTVLRSKRPREDD